MNNVSNSYISISLLIHASNKFKTLYKLHSHWIIMDIHYCVTIVPWINLFSDNESRSIRALIKDLFIFRPSVYVQTPVHNYQEIFNLFKDYVRSIELCVHNWCHVHVENRNTVESWTSYCLKSGRNMLKLI